jgi:hypothetical protein
MTTESPERRVRRVPLTLAAFIGTFLVIVAVVLILLFAL